MPTAIALFATAGFVAYLALWPAIAGYVAVRFTASHSITRVIAAASLWTLCEWLRGWLFTGMPWLSVGYAELPGSMLARYAPIGGVYLVSFAVAVTAAMIALIVDGLAHGQCRRIAAFLAVCGALYAGGAALARMEWTRPDGAPVAVSLIQGNILQDVKFDPEFRERTFEIYAGLVEQSRGKLIVLPESAYPTRCRIACCFNLPAPPASAAVMRCWGSSLPRRRCRAPTSRATSTPSSHWVQASCSSIANAISFHSARRFPANRSSAGSFAACWQFRLLIRRPAIRSKRRLRWPERALRSTSATKTHSAAN